MDFTMIAIISLNAVAVIGLVIMALYDRKMEKKILGNLLEELELE